MLEVLLIDRCGEEIEKVGHDRLCALALQKVDDVVVGERHVLDQNLTDNADAGLADRFVDGEGVEVLDKKKEETDRSSRVHKCITYHADKELLKKGIIRKVDE